MSHKDYRKIIHCLHEHAEVSVDNTHTYTTQKNTCRNSGNIHIPKVLDDISEIHKEMITYTTHRIQFNI